MAEGVTDLDAWLSEPEQPQPLLHSVLFKLFHIEADLRWIDHTETRLATLAEEVRDDRTADRP